MRADIAPTRWNGNDLSDAFIQGSIETVSSDDDDEEDHGRPTPDITPSPRIEEIEDVRDSQAEGEVSTNSPENTNDSGDSGPSGPNVCQSEPESPPGLREARETLDTSSGEETTNQGTVPEVGIQQPIIPAPTPDPPDRTKRRLIPQTATYPRRTNWRATPKVCVVSLLSLLSPWRFFRRVTSTVCSTISAFPVAK
ncbi:hypothetical protein HO173_004303 [Letharia columbiana]|uniref:Uncharacterized protein n=1 Tax=Letharia columbiana TaxID=112416 RepID=A0A8H6FZ24_9LECA|nr:uncharacterized protein HO173_004303 [Letharia columbiana]KAF6237413.1 hypothetical protein HO173_004303 [Letharia columbiana]